MNSTSEPPVRIPARTPGDVLAVVPHLLGFHPQTSLVILGLAGPSQRVRLAFRYDLPDPPDRAVADAIGYHTAKLLRRQHLATALVIGYGPGTLVTPVVDALRTILAVDRVRLQDALRVDEGRYWSYLCDRPVLLPARRRPRPRRHPSSRRRADTSGPARRSQPRRASPPPSPPSAAPTPTR